MELLFFGASSGPDTRRGPIESASTFSERVLVWAIMRAMDEDALESPQAQH
jgi:hypothetical protein